MFFQLLLLHSFKSLTWDYDIGGTRISWFPSLALYISWFLGSKLKSRTDNKCTFEYSTCGGLAFCDCWETWSAWFPSATFTWRIKQDRAHVKLLLLPLLISTVNAHTRSGWTRRCQPIQPKASTTFSLSPPLYFPLDNFCRLSIPLIKSIQTNALRMLQEHWKKTERLNSLHCKILPNELFHSHTAEYGGQKLKVETPPVTTYWANLTSLES